MTRVIFFMFAAAVVLMLSGCATDLGTSIMLNDVAAVRSSINQGNVNRVDEAGFTPLIRAVLFQKKEMAKLLIIEKNADVNIGERNGGTPLIFAASLGQTEIAELLIEKGANVNSVHSNGNTPLIMATAKGHAEIAKLLIEKGANVNSVGEAGNTPLKFAAGTGLAEVAKLLIEKGANVNSANMTGGTPLHDAAINGRLEIVKLLVSKNANVSLRTNAGSSVGAGKTALDLAKEKNFTEICNVLVAPSPKLVAELNALIKKKDMPGLGAYLDAHPEALSSIEDESLRLRFTGPAELRIIDIEQLAKGGSKDALIIAQINGTSGTYKKFTANEIASLKKMGISDEVVAAMIALTTEYNKEQKRLAEQQRVAQPAQQTQPVQQAQQPTPIVAKAESDTPAECLKLIAALKACDQTGGFMAMGCKGLARSQFNCPTVAQYMR